MGHMARKGELAGLDKVVVKCVGGGGGGGTECTSPQQTIGSTPHSDTNL